MKHLTSLGVLLAAAAIASLFHVLFTNLEKEAVYLLGHWFDTFWELQLPCLCLGLLIILGSIYRNYEFGS
jgi:hypothetical protein